jgi:hypothetical protein
VDFHSIVAAEDDELIRLSFTPCLNSRPQCAQGPRVNRHAGPGLDRQHRSAAFKEKINFLTAMSPPEINAGRFTFVSEGLG